MAEKPSVEQDIDGDMTRESLIAISYSLPEPDATSLPLQKKPHGGNDTVGEKDGSSVEDLRSELISLSYTSPDVEPLPEVKG